MSFCLLVLYVPFCHGALTLDILSLKISSIYICIFFYIQTNDQIILGRHTLKYNVTFNNNDLYYLIYLFIITNNEQNSVLGVTVVELVE